MRVAQVLLHFLMPQPQLSLPSEEAGVAPQAGGQQHGPGGGTVQQGGDPMGGEEVGAEVGEGGEEWGAGCAGQAAEPLFWGEHPGKLDGVGKG